MDGYTVRLKLKSEHCDLNRNLRIDTLLHLLQETAVSHTELLGMGREKTLDKGLLWVIDKEVIEITRLPKYDEEIEIISSPSKTLHYFFPRRSEIRDRNGKVLLKAMTLWSLMDEKTRGIVDPEEFQIRIDGEERLDDLKMAVPSLKKEKLTSSAYLKARFTDCDLNGHLNHAGYLNFAQNLLPDDVVMNHGISFLGMTFLHEIRPNEKVLVHYGNDGLDWSFSSKAFHLILKYKER